MPKSKILPTKFSRYFGNFVSRVSALVAKIISMGIRSLLFALSPAFSRTRSPRKHPKGACWFSLWKEKQSQLAISWYLNPRRFPKTEQTNNNNQLRKSRTHFTIQFSFSSHNSLSSQLSYTYCSLIYRFGSDFILHHISITS